MRTDAQRTDQYYAKTAPTTVGLKIAAMLPLMRQSFAAGTNLLVPKQIATAAVLDAETIVGPMRGRYHAFSNRLYKIVRLYSGPAATQMAQIEHDKWEAVCQSAVMVKIAIQVYSLVVA